jgi:hypothetical protein
MGKAGRGDSSCCEKIATVLTTIKGKARRRISRLRTPQKKLSKPKSAW